MFITICSDFAIVIAIDISTMILQFAVSIAVIFSMHTVCRVVVYLHS